MQHRQAIGVGDGVVNRQRIAVQAAATLYIVGIAVGCLSRYGKGSGVYYSCHIVHYRSRAHARQQHPEYAVWAGYDRGRVGVCTVTVHALRHSVVQVLKLRSRLYAAIGILIARLAGLFAGPNTDEQHSSERERQKEILFHQCKSEPFISYRAKKIFKTNKT
jgi:hypothetical protein